MEIIGIIAAVFIQVFCALLALIFADLHAEFRMGRGKSLSRLLGGPRGVRIWCLIFIAFSIIIPWVVR